MRNAKKLHPQKLQKISPPSVSKKIGTKKLLYKKLIHLLDSGLLVLVGSGTDI